MSNWFKDINIKPYSLNLTEEKVENSLEHIGTRDNFLNRTPMAQALRPTINEWSLMKLKSFCKAKNFAKRTKWQSRDWKNISTNSTFNRGLISKMYKG